MARYKALRLGFITLLLVLLTAVAVHRNRFFASENAAIPEVQARSAESFNKTVGFGMHSWYTAFHFDRYIDALVELNARHARDDIIMSRAQYEAWGANASGQWINRMKKLRDRGIKVQAISDPIRVPIDDVVWFVKQSEGAITAVEGANEGDAGCRPDPNVYTQSIYVICSPLSNWQTIIGNYWTSVRTALKNDPATQNTAILSPSFTGNAFGMQTDTYKRHADTIGNIHYYPFWWANTPSTLQQTIVDARQNLYTGKPIAVTETGYPSLPEDNWPVQVDETWQARLVPIYLLEGYRQGAVQSLIYTIVSPTAEIGWGMLDNTGRKKPVFDAVKNLTNLLQDSREEFLAGKLRYQLEGRTLGVSSLLLQKTNGKFYLLLWQTQLANSPAPQAGQSLTPKTVTVSFGNDLAETKIYKPVSSAVAEQTINQPQALRDLVIGNELVVIETTLAQSQNNSSNGSSGSSNNQQTNQQTSSNNNKKNNSKQKTSNQPAAPAAETPSPNDDGFSLPSLEPPRPPTFWERVARLLLGIYSFVVRIF